MKKILFLTLLALLIFTTTEIDKVSLASSENIKIKVEVFPDLGFVNTQESFEEEFQQNTEEVKILEKITKLVNEKLTTKKDRVVYSVEIDKYVKNKSITFLAYSVDKSIVKEDKSINSNIKEVKDSEELSSKMKEDLKRGIRNSRFYENGKTKYLTFQNQIDGTLMVIDVIYKGEKIKTELIPSTKIPNIILTDLEYNDVMLRFKYLREGKSLTNSLTIADLKDKSKYEPETVETGFRYAYVLDNVLTFNFTPKTSVRSRGGFYWRIKGEHFIEERNNGYPRSYKGRYFEKYEDLEDLFRDSKFTNYDKYRQMNKNDYMIELRTIPTTVQIVIEEDDGKQYPIEIRVDKNNTLITSNAPPYWSKLKMSAFKDIAERKYSKVIDLEEGRKVDLINIFEPQIVSEFGGFSSKDIEITVDGELVTNYKKYKLEEGVYTVNIYNSKTDENFTYFMNVGNYREKKNFEVKEKISLGKTIRFRDAIKFSKEDSDLETRFGGFVVVYDNTAYTLDTIINVDKNITKKKFEIHYRGKKYKIVAEKNEEKKKINIPDSMKFPNLGERKIK